jgi:YfiH family protein
MLETWIPANWPAPAHIKAGVATRNALQIGGDRNALRDELKLPDHPMWLNQVHSATVLDLTTSAPGVTLEDADGSITTATDQVLCVITADCLPILICNRAGTEIAALHAGWRGLAQGIIPAAFDKMKSAGDDCLVWIGPGISAEHYEVGEELFDTFMDLDETNEQAFAHNHRGRWQCCLYTLARLELARCGVTQVSGGEYCTFRDESLFYSYRREAVTGRQASLIWIHPSS